MATMYPSTIPDHLRRDSRRGAEIRIYELLKKQLPDSFACYWSRPWHRFRPNGSEQDGEVDFVIAHPKRGLLSIEVKGGRVSCNNDGQWFSKDRYEIDYAIKNPIDQARNGKYRLLELLKESRDWKGRFIIIRHGVILPDNARPVRALGADAPLELFAFGNDLGKLGDWVEGRLAGEGETGDGLGQDGMLALQNVLAAKFELRPHLSRTLSDDFRQIERLTAEQSWIIDSLEDNPQMAISGAAGTGKTVLALEKALRDASASKRTLFVCFNSALASHSKTVIGSQENLTVAGFHELCGSIAQKASVTVPKTSSPQLFDRLLPEALLQSMDENPDWKFDAIIVDEGQDFKDDWLDILRLILRDPDTSDFYVFHDDNQQIFTTDKVFLDALPKASYHLNQNLRNTKAIHKVLTPWYDSRRIISVGPNGSDVEWTECKDRQQAHAKALTLVTNLIRTEQLKPEDIAILTGMKRGDCELFQRSHVAGQTITDANSAGTKGAVVCDTVRRYKGLEAKCVILIDTDHIIDLMLKGFGK